MRFMKKVCLDTSITKETFIKFNDKKHNFLVWIVFTIKSIMPLVSLPVFQIFEFRRIWNICIINFFGTFISGISNLGLLNVLKNYFEISEEQRNNFLFSVVIFVLCIISSSTFIVFLFQKSLAI